MALMKLSDYYADTNRDLFNGHDMTNFTVYANDADDQNRDHDKVGSVKGMLIDEADGRFRYFIVDTGFWFFGKQVLLPVGLARLDFDKERLYVAGLTKDQVENLPKFSDDLKIDDDYEERVRSSYRPAIPSSTRVQALGGGALAGSPSSDLQEPGHYDLNDPVFRSSEQRLRDLRTNRASRF